MAEEVSISTLDELAEYLTAQAASPEKITAGALIKALRALADIIVEQVQPEPPVEPVEVVEEVVEVAE